MTTPPASRALILCADDYALHLRVDDAVQQLARAGRLSATSCMTTAPRWPAAAMALKPLRPQLSVGLHFNLTESHEGAYAAQTLGGVIRQAYSGRLAQTWLQDAWCRQLDAFEQAMGSAPDFIDGHQHVHQLPGVRQALLRELQARYARSTMPWVRSTAPTQNQLRNVKALIIAFLGGWTAARGWRRAGLSTNRGFSGVYGFDAPDEARYGTHMQAWLAQGLDAGLLMCHPATGEVPGDAISQQRPVEFAYLMSPAFGQLLQLSGVQIHQGAFPRSRRG